MNSKPAQLGFTLIEAMVVVSILAILAGIAAPAFQQMLAAQRVKNAASDLLSDMILARSEAIRRNGTVTVGPIDADWSKGWEIKAGAETIKQKNLSANSLTLSKKAGDDLITFNGTGRSTGTTSVDLTAPGLAGDQQKRCAISSAAGGQKIAKGPCA